MQTKIFDFFIESLAPDMHSSHVCFFLYGAFPGTKITTLPTLNFVG